MSLETWISFCILEILVCLSPGPAVIFITSTTAVDGVKAAIIGLGGILASNILYFALSAGGVATVLLTSNIAFTAIRLLGGGYLIYLGLSMILKKSGYRATSVPTQHSSYWLKGLLIQCSNPKALAYFIALLPQFINPDAAVLPQILILGTTSVVIESLVMLFYVTTAQYGTNIMGSGKAGIFRALAGGFMVFAGSRLLVFDN